MNWGDLMKRTKLDDRVLPDYTRGEEIFNMVTHIVGGAFGIAVLVLCIVFGAIRGNGYGIKVTSNPDYLIEGKVFDCYTPKRGTSIRNISSTIEKKTLSQTNNIVLNLEQSDVNVSQITKQLAEYPIDGLSQLIIIKNNQYYLLAN